MSLKILLDELENELIETRNKMLRLDRDNHILKREVLVLEDAEKKQGSKIEEQEKHIGFLKDEIRISQKLANEISHELEQTRTELKYWYKEKMPSLTKYFKERFKHATNTFKRQKKTLL